MIHANEARQVVAKKNQVKKDTYKAILESFMKKIRVALEANNKSVVLEVPIFLAGFPMFDRKNATDYLARQLTLLGYTVDRLSPFSVLLTWSKRVEETVDSNLVPSLVNVHKFAGEIRRKNQR